jgi:hypothetical protein
MITTLRCRYPSVPDQVEILSQPEIGSLAAGDKE